MAIRGIGTSRSITRSHRMRPTIVIPVHNRRDLTLGCLRHLASVGDLETHDAVVVDDGSNDGTGDAVRREFNGRVEVIRGSGDLWWTGAISVGMAHAFGRGAPAVYWLNDDCLPDRGTLSGLAFADVPVPGGRHRMPDTNSKNVLAAHLGQVISAPVCVRADSSTPVPIGFVGRKSFASIQGIQPVDGLSGFCVRVPRAVWAKIGLPDAEKYPHYYGDTSYTLAATRAGFRCVIVGSCRAQLIRYVPRAESVRRYVGRLAQDKGSWRQTFVETRSPFRIRTQSEYLRLRYGPLAGSLLALLRVLSWQSQWLGATLRRASSTAENLNQHRNL
jgi:glycosyltransferase involved in cell wall biosynthesis